MKLIKPYFEILEQESSVDGMYKHIELCGRNAYKSEDKITDDSAKAFVDKICKAKHGSVLEHGTVYLKIHWNLEKDSIFNEVFKFYSHNKYSKIYKVIEPSDFCPTLYITTNYRVVKDNNRLEDLKYLHKYDWNHERRFSVRFVCSRAISHELVRHRTFSATMESQRYCNYSKDKFSNEITFIEPLMIDKKALPNFSYVYENIYEVFYSAIEEAEAYYFILLDAGCKPEEAREVLPNSTKTDIIMTGFISDWKHFFELRTAENVHPEMKRLTIPLKEEFIKRGYI